MGNLVGGQQPAVVPQNPVEQEPAYNPDNPDTHHRKRKVENTVESIETPTKKRLCSASAYIYRTLFKGGENSDITVVALGKEWRLHRHYLFQSPYFASMLQGPWEENNADKIQLQIMDENVTVTALDVVFGSLYSDEVQLEADNVCSVLVAATELHMDALLKECDTVIRENLGSKTILEYEATARQYCGSSLHEACVTWLARQLLTSCQETELCSRISPALMKLILNSKDLLMLQVEQDLYIYMRKWLYLQENPDYVEKFPTLTNLTAEYFTERFEKTDEAYLDCEIGRRFCGVMRLIRLQHILCDLAPCHTMLREGIFPRGANLTLQNF